MRLWQSQDFVTLRFLRIASLGAAIGAATGACTTYSDLDVDSRPDSRAPTPDVTTPPADHASSDTMTPPLDMGGMQDTGSVDTAVDQPRDTSAPETMPPADAMRPDAGTDVSVGTDATVDVTPPSTDADTGVPPAPDVGDDVAPPVPDVVDAGPPVADADADAPSPPADADAGSGTPDIRDSGPTCWGTPSANDEDGDGVVDECDNCPSVSNANQANVGEVNAGGTADGVGDACDPRPAAGNDTIFFFDGMNFTSIPSTWTNVGAGSWTASGTSMSPTSTASGQELERSFPSALGNYLAETAFTFTALTTLGSASIPFRTDASRNGWGCGVGINGSAGDLFLTQVTGGTGEANPSTATIPVPGVGDRFRLLAGAYSTSLYCMIAGGSARVNRSNSSSTSGESGIRASGVDATFEYFLVYRLGGTVP